jgi:hypothetical protein
MQRVKADSFFKLQHNLHQKTVKLWTTKQKLKHQDQLLFPQPGQEIRAADPVLSAQVEHLVEVQAAARAVEVDAAPERPATNAAADDHVLSA